MAINLGLRRRTPEEEEALLGSGGLLSSDAAYTAAPAHQSETTKAINQGVENLKATGLGLRAFGRGVVGDEQGAQRDALASLKTSEDAAVAGPRVQSTKDVKGVGDAAEYVRNTILTQGPNLAASLVGGGAGAAVGRKVVGKVAANAAGKAAAEAAGGSVDDLTRFRVGRAAAQAAKPTAAAAGRGMQVGGAVGAGGSSVALEAGQMAPEGITAESPDDLQTRLFKVGVGSLAAGSIDAYPAFRLLRKTGAFGALAQDEVAKTSRRMLNRIAREAGQQAVVEGGTELAQTVIEKASQKWIDDRINLLSPEAMQEYLDATIAGGTLGFFSGAAGASVSLPANVRASIASRRAAAKGVDLSKGKGGSVAENVARAEEALKEANDDEVDFSDIDNEPDDFEFESFTLPGQQPSPSPDTAASMAQNIPANILNRIRDPRTPPELRRQLELEVLRRSEQIDEAEAAEVTDKADTSSRQLEAALGDDAQFGISGIQKLFSGGTIKPDWTPDKTLLSAVKRTKGQSLSPDEVRAVKLIDELIGSDPAAKQALVERYGALTDTTEEDARARRYDAAKSGGTAIDPKALKGITRSAASSRRFGDRTLRSAIKDLARSGDEEAASMLDTLNKRVSDAQGKENDIRKRNKAADGVYGQFLKDLGRKNPALANRVQEQLNSGYEGMSLVDSIHQPARDRFTPESELQVVDKNGNEGVVDIPHLISYLRSVSGETAPRDSTGAIMLNEQFLTQLADNYGKALELLGSDNGELRMGNAKAVQSAMDRDGLVLFHNPKTGDKVTLGTLKERGYFKSQGGGKITLPNGKEIVVKDDTALINQDGKDFDPADMEQEISGREANGDARVPGGDTFRANSKRATAPQLDVIEALQGVPANTANARVEAKTKLSARGDNPKRGQITPNDPAFVDQRKPVSDRTQADWNKNVLPAKPAVAAKRGKKVEKVDTSAQNLLDTETGTGGNTALRERVRGNAENAAKAAAAQKGVKANSLSHQMELLARMRKAFKAMTPQERASKKGKALDARIDGVKAYIKDRFDTMVPEGDVDSGPEPTKVSYKDGPKQAAHKDVHPAAADEVSARRQARRERHFAEKAAEKEKPTPQTNVLPKVRKKRSDSATSRVAEATAARLAAQLDRQDAFAANKRTAIEARAKRIEDRKKVAANKARFQAEKAARRGAKVSGEPLNVWFGSRENSSLSNLAPRPFEYEGHHFFTVEHAYQSLKSGTFDKATADKYRSLGGGEKIRGKAAKTEGGWNVALMERLVLASFEQNPASAKALLDTGNRPITHTQDKGIWAKAFPEALMAARETLRNNPKPVYAYETKFTTSNVSGYAARTRSNANADATIAIAADFTTAGEKLTARMVTEQGKQLVQVGYRGQLATDAAVNSTVAKLNAVGKKKITLNIAGNGIYTLKSLGDQKAVDAYTLDFLGRVLAHPDLKTKIESVRSGGQTGFDEAGIKAARALGLPTIVHGTKDYAFRPANGVDIKGDRVAFEARFADTKSKQAEDTAGPSPADIHELAKSKGIKTDNDPDFMDLSEALTGERHLDAMSPGQLQTIANFLSPMKESVKKANRLLAYVDNIVTTAKPNVESLNRIARGMLDHLGIGTKVNVVFVDPADAPTLGFGSVKASPDGSYKITLRSTMRGADLMSTLSHEIGHIIKWEAFDKLSTAEKTEVLEAFESWRDGQIDTVGEAIVSRAPAARQQLIKDAGYAMDKKLSAADANYTLAFDEWFADNAARYLTTDKETTGIIGKFFAEVVMQLRALGAVFGMKAAPDAAIKNLLDGMRPSQAAVRAARYHDSLLRHIAYNNIPPETTAGQAVAAIHALTNPGTRASALSVREIFRGLPDGARYVLTRVVQRNFVANQLRAAVKDPVVLKAMESPEAGIETRVAVAYELWTAGKLKIADAQHPLRAMSDAIMKAVGVMSNTQYFEQFLADTHSGVTNTTRRYDLFARTVRDAKANALGKALSTIEDYYYETVSPMASKVFTEGVGDRLRNRQIPAMTEFALVFKALSGERASDPGLVPARQREAIHLNTLSGKAFEGLDEVDMSAIHDVFMGLSTPGKLTVAQKKAYFAVSKNFDHVYDYLQKAGVKFDKKKNYFPVVMKEAVELGQMHTEFVEFFAKNFDGAMRMKLMSVFGDKLPPKKRMALMDELIGPNKKTAEEVAEIFYRMATGRDDAQTPEWAQGQRPSFRYMNEQLMDFVLEGTPEQLAKFSDFREPNLAYVTHRYNEAAARRAEFQRRFPETDSVEAYFTRAKAQGATEADLTLMRNYMDVMMGNYGLEYPQALKSLFQGIDKLTGTELADNPALARKIQGYILVYQNIRLLGLATLSSITDSLGIAVRSGKFTDIWAAYRDTFKSLRSSGGMKAAWEAAQDLGVVESTVTNEALAMAYGGQYLTRNARRVNDFFFEAIGLTRLTQATRVASTVMAHRFLLRHAKGEGVGARYLAELGLEVGDITSKDGEFIDLHTKNAARDARVRNAMIRFVDESILRPDASQRPLWMSDPNYALITQYKSFTYAFYSTVVKRMAHEFRNGNYQPLMMVLAYVPIMLVAELAREFIKHGEDGDPRRVNWGAEDYAWQATQRTGLLGPKEYLTDALADPARGNLPGSSFLGPTAAQARSWMGRKPVQKLSIEALPLSSVTKNYIAPSAPEPVIQEGMQ